MKNKRMDYISLMQGTAELTSLYFGTDKAARGRGYQVKITGGMRHRYPGERLLRCRSILTELFSAASSVLEVFSDVWMLFFFLEYVQYQMCGFFFMKCSFSMFFSVGDPAVLIMVAALL